MPDTRQQNAARNDADVIVIGAGAAGLTAAAELAEAGRSVTILEARDRIGGRMFTLHDPRFQFPIELGAEFIHGRPPEIFDTLQQHNVPITEVDGDNWCVRDNRITSCDFFSEVTEILERMDDRGPDESFQSFLNRCCLDASAETKQHASDYVSGFNAADPALVSVHWLVQQSRAEEKIEGERAFRAHNGYTSLLDILHQRAVKNNARISTKTVVERVTWSKGNVTIDATSNESPVSFHAPRVLLTIPLGVLQAPAGARGSIEFCPALPPERLKALAGLEMGKVIRIVLRFRERFWDHIAPDQGHPKTLADMSFLFSKDDWFPTWWTTLPEQVPLITGWAPFRCAERLAADNIPFADRALQTLSTSLKVERKNLDDLLEDAHFHNWQDDPFSRGAYSYARVGSLHAPEILGSPIEDTLFFAGEATDISGNNGTVHGAIASARRALADIQRAVAGH
jgi:monoamine oxidase